MQTEDRKAESESLDWPEVEDDDAIWYRPLLEGYGIYAFTVYDADIETWVFDETLASETELKRHETIRRLLSHDRPGMPTQPPRKSRTNTSDFPRA